jgi:hypothetical protein
LYVVAWGINACHPRLALVRDDPCRVGSRNIRIEPRVEASEHLQRKTADRYLEVGFTRQAGATTRNDYWYRRAAVEADWQRITVYRNGELVYGVEP